jgi:hypothetical protein
MISVRDILGSKIQNDLIEVAYNDMFKRVHTEVANQVSNQICMELTKQIGNQVWNEVKSHLYLHIKQNKKL